MPCLVLEDIVKSCDNNSGGIYGIWINQQDEIASITPTDPSAGAGWSITGITLAGVNLFQNFYIRRNTSNFTEESNIDLVNGSSFVTSTINLMFHRRDAAKSRAIKILGGGQQYLTAIIWMQMVYTGTSLTCKYLQQVKDLAHLVRMVVNIPLL